MGISLYITKFSVTKAIIKAVGIRVEGMEETERTGTEATEETAAHGATKSTEGERKRRRWVGR
jgi:hypothetical protein